MKSPHSLSSIANLLKLYRIRLQVAEAKVAVQRQKVADINVELAEREGKVSALDQKMEANRQFIRQAESGSAVEVKLQGHRHDYWLDYDRQKESFYLEMTRDELAVEVDELRQLQQRVDKLTVKIDTVEKMRKKGEAARSRSLQREAEAELSSMIREEAAGGW